MNENTKVITLQDVFSLIPERPKNSSKYDYGKLLCFCGSTFYRGAAFLSCAGALRSGVGICTLASIEKVVASVSARLPECTFLPLDESKGGTIVPPSEEEIASLSKKYSAILIGCGLSIDENTKELVSKIIKNAECQLIIDADAINTLAEDVSLIGLAKLPPILTPHYMEMARLVSKTWDIVANNPQKIAADFAKKYNCYIVLKSSETFVASPDGNFAINKNNGNSGLAKGGSGDILAGMISSFCAQKIAPFDAAKCGVYLHGKSADLCAQRLSKQGMLPSDILTDLSGIFAD